jgi:TrmH family RNA methyltransferase
MGGLFKVNLIFGKREELLSLITMPIIVADMKGENAFKFGNNFKDNFCLVIGNEANGVSELLKNSATYTVSIPMQNGMESLNAGVAAGILMYQLKK